MASIKRLPDEPWDEFVKRRKSIEAHNHQLLGGYYLTRNEVMNRHERRQRGLEYAPDDMKVGED